ncbi:single-pass membrane and coiled-coil domain-containing protein 3-like [Onychostoma macrolepis]|uniref:single-pass membrane and coiled-coil domain-containing protein 3-like n=1 Tax=Onychostoma macrolepis TaxID=369639 RepID=UPI00272C7999|nr:single-pass membrane and coiled-coil domain-containing protein 3-like [Onychostoma macrolepis]XP_058632652.1 single-pass membrane and coiled-coil domain-containing protein 3-like [Onychostoma macrolepis]XP_058632653.1 single-pass membrane and coiled-coil domain-containing protein 3-like [Onychostoma macrolepis]
MWSDIFYPENPKRKEQLIRRSQEIQDLMKNNFRATNQLIDAMNKYLSCSFEHITLNESATLRENCDVMIGCMNMIQAEVEKIDKKLKEKLEPTLYKKLRKVSSLSSVDFKAISNAFAIVCGIGSLGSAVLFGCLLKNGTILANITSKFVKIGATALAGVVLAVVFLGIDMIVEAIIGKIEGDQLQAELEKYDRALAEFRPASEQYQDNITYVRIKIDILNE